MARNVSLAALRERLVSEGIEAARHTRHAAHADQKRAGAVRGLELCRDLATPEQFSATLKRLRSEQDELRRTRAPLAEYWAKTAELAQVELVYEVLRVGWAKPVLGARRFSGRAAIRYRVAVAAVLKDRAARGHKKHKPEAKEE